jgi:putative transposase
VITLANVIKGRGYVYSLQYHVVWCVKYRHKIITGSVEEYLEILIRNIADDNNITIIGYNSDLDHIHMLIECTPQHYIPDMIKALKGASARLLFKKFGNDLKSQLWGGHLWNPSYFISTVSENSEEQIRDYIQSQKRKA